MKKNVIKKRLLSLLLVGAIISSSFVSFAAEATNRAEADAKYKWNLESLFSSSDDFKSELGALEKELKTMSKYEGNLNNVESVVKMTLDQERLYKRMSRLQTYASCKLSIDQTSNEAIELNFLVNQLASKFYEAFGYSDGEISELSEETIRAIMNDNRISKYRSYYDNFLDQEDSEMTEAQNAIQEVLSLSDALNQTPYDIYKRLVAVDQYPLPVVLEDGSEMVVTKEEAMEMMERNDEAEISALIKAINESSDKLNNAFATALSTKVIANKFQAEAREYSSTVEYLMDLEQIPKSVYDNLLQATNDNLKLVQEYYGIKKEKFGLDKMTYQDTARPLSDSFDRTFTYEEAVEILKKALKPLGEDYVRDFAKGIDNRWVDVYPGERKEQGAFAGPGVDEKPIVLMNFVGDYDSVSTLAHEMGHAMNYYYTQKKQNPQESDIPIFTAEVASIGNELLLNDYMIKNAESKDEKLYYLGKQIEWINSTFFTQVMFSEFENTLYEKVEAGEPLTADVLNDIWAKLSKKYDGKELEMSEDMETGWKQIHHFYEDFYVYKYATSLAASYKLVDPIIKGEEGAVEKYREFLAAGNVENAIDTLKSAGVDMTTKEPVDTLLSYYKELIETVRDTVK
jgi:oligoendopeptidase F